MVFQIKTYSVLLVSAAQKFTAALRQLLPVTDFWPVTVAANAAQARRILLEGSFDIVIINSPLPDEYGSGFAVDVCSGSSCSVLIFVKDDMYEAVCGKVVEHGVFVLSKPAPVQMITQSLRMMCAMRERLIRMEEKQISVEEKIAQIRVFNHAKWLLIENEHMSENEVQRYIEKNAMDNRATKQDIAQGIISRYDEKR